MPSNGELTDTIESGGFRLGVDVGGTFTDLMWAAPGHLARIAKVPTRIDDPYGAICEGLAQMDVAIGKISMIAFGTTIATNIVIERTGARTALLCTRGFRDVLEHQRWHRRYLYDLQQTRPEPLVPRHLRIGVGERVGADGTVLQELDSAEVSALIEALQREGVTSVAMCFLNSYRNSANEEAAGQALRNADSGLYVSLSSELAPLIREWERTSTTVVNAYVQPAIHRHLSMLQTSISESAPNVGLHIMQSNGGVISVENASAEPVKTILSGPAAGVVGAGVVGEAVGEPHLITMDMGGTSCDVALVREGTPQVSKEGEAGYNIPITVPMLNIKTIGAGGGSIVWIDSGGALKVGPASAGAVPGPACYRRGGTQPTVTDAQLTLGRLSAGGLLGGRMSLDPNAAETALGGIAEQCGMSTLELAAGVVRISNVLMAEAIRMITVNQGLDPRDFALLAFGGAGPLHACEIADELQIPKVIIPGTPGVLSAMGLAGAAVKVGAVNALNTSLGALSIDDIEAEYGRLEARCHLILDEHQIPRDRRMLERSADLRYRQQSFEVTVPVPAGATDSLAELFTDLHRSRYQYALPNEVPFLVNIEVTARGHQQAEPPRPLGDGTSAPEPSGSRAMFVLEGEEWVNAPVFQRDALLPRHRLVGPAIVDQLDSTLIILPGYVGDVDASGAIVLTREVETA